MAYLPQLRIASEWTFLTRLAIVMLLVRLTDKAKPYAHRTPQHHCSRAVALVVTSWILLILGVLSLSCGNRLHSQLAQQAQDSERSGQLHVQSGQPSAAKPDTRIDDAWTAVTAQDASPSLATPDDTTPMGHQIALTFDDGPDPATTPAILDVLRRYDIKATFFVVGARAEQHPDLIRRIASEGHTLGNHTYYHRDMTTLTPKEMSQELRDTQTAIDQALGYRSRITLFRPPCGAPYITETDKLPSFQKFMEKEKMYPVMWNVDSRDWALGGRPDLIVDNIVQSTPQDGGVVLLHDTQPQTVEALPKIIHYYQTAHFGFTSVRELLAKKYGVAPEGIEANHSDTPSPRVNTRFSGSGDPKDLSSRAECLTF
jgi:peptidoglycan/xylan/chitin deacetylase (PgdA/CDA1 family)